MPEKKEKKDEKPKRGPFLEDFGKAFNKAGTRARLEHKHDLGKPPKFDSDVMESGLGGFTEPEDDGVKA